MQQQNGIDPTTVTPSQRADTGPGAEATTPTVIGFDMAGPGQECSAIVLVKIERGQVTITASLDMGGHHAVSRKWRQSSSGSWSTTSRDFIDAENVLGVELAEFADSIDFPGRVARMLPRPATSAAAAAIAEAAKEVGNA